MASVTQKQKIRELLDKDFDMDAGAVVAKVGAISKQDVYNVRSQIRTEKQRNLPKVPVPAAVIQGVKPMTEEKMEIMPAEVNGTGATKPMKTDMLASEKVILDAMTDIKELADDLGGMDRLLSLVQKMMALGIK
jgi:hypothetical protein